MITWFFVLQALASLIATGHLLLQDKTPQVQLTWILVILLFPILGVLLYASFGTDRLFLRRTRQRMGYDPIKMAEFQPPGLVAIDDEVDHDYKGMARALSNLSDAPLTAGNRVELLGEAEHFYPRLVAAIDGARETLWVSYYVWREDSTGHEFVERLAAAARRGVEVRLLVDEVGSGQTSREMFDPLIEAGGKFTWATTLFPRRNRWFVNLRNHRKITIVDGRFGFTGGMNIGDEYIEGVEGNKWNDLQVLLEGPIVMHLAAVFADDWHFATQERLDPPAQMEPQEAGCLCQLVRGGPEQYTSSVGGSVAAMINSAQTEVIASTPYFIPDEWLMTALALAAARGVRVRLLVSSETDMGAFVLLSRSYFDQLMAMGVHIYEYPHDIHHAKCVIIDDEVALVGSINLDVRSFHLNYEIGVVMFDKGYARQVRKYLEDRLGDQAPIDRQEFAKRPMHERLREGGLRLLAPML